MMGNEGDVCLGLFIGVFITGSIMLAAFHMDESGCQKEHNVADCKWVLIPATEESK